MRTVLFLLLSCVPVLAQFPYSGSEWSKTVAASGGCAGVAGAPGFTLSSTNKLATGAVTITATLPAITGGCNPYVLVFSGQFNVTITGVTNSAGQSGALWTNYSTGCTPVEKGGVWVFNNPPTSQQVYGAQFSGSASQSGIVVMAYTNVSALGNVYTNCVSGNGTMTVTASSASNELITQSTLSDKDGTAAPGINGGVTTGTLRAMADNGTADQTIYVWTQTGATSATVTAGISSGSGWNAQIVCCLKGF